MRKRPISRSPRCKLTRFALAACLNKLTCPYSRGKQCISIHLDSSTTIVHSAANQQICFCQYRPCVPNYDHLFQLKQRLSQFESCELEWKCTCRPHAFKQGPRPPCIPRTLQTPTGPTRKSTLYLGGCLCQGILRGPSMTRREAAGSPLLLCGEGTALRRFSPHLALQTSFGKSSRHPHMAVELTIIVL